MHRTLFLIGRSVGLLSSVLTLSPVAFAQAQSKPTPAANAEAPLPAPKQERAPSGPSAEPANAKPNDAEPSVQPSAGTLPTASPAPEGHPAPVADGAAKAVPTLPAPSPSPKPATAVANSAPPTPLNALFHVGLVIQNSWNTAPAYDYFASDDTFLMGGLAVGVDAAHFGPQTVLNVELSVVNGSTEDPGPLPTYVTQASLRRLDLGAGVTVRHHVFSWLAPHLRLAGSAALEKASVTLVDSGTLDVEETKAAAFVGGGLTLFTPAKRLSDTNTYFNSLALRVSIEGGYQVLGGMPFEVESQPASTEEPVRNVAKAAVSLGELPQSGAYLRATAAAHF